MRIDPGGKLNGTIFLSVGKMPLMSLSMNYVLNRTGTITFRTIANLTRMLLSSIWTCNMIVPTSLNFWLIALFSRALTHVRINGSQSGSERSSRSN